MTRIQALCVYCGSSPHGPQSHRDAAIRLGRMMAERGIRLVYGGGRVGMMGAIAEAVLAAGGQVTGIIPRHLFARERARADNGQLLVVDTMHTRKAKMAELADGFVVLPGGLGTLDETFEIVTWKQLGLHDKPIVIADIDGYWRPLHAMIDGIVTGRYATPSTADLVTFVSDIDEVFSALTAAPTPQLRVASERL
jgi:uncharacterized protein (TIGR00730 family)